MSLEEVFLQLTGSDAAATPEAAPSTDAPAPEAEA